MVKFSMDDSRRRFTLSMIRTRTHYNWMDRVILLNSLLPSACGSHVFVGGKLRELKLVQMPVHNDVVVVWFAQLLVP